VRDVILFVNKTSHASHYDAQNRNTVVTKYNLTFTFSIVFQETYVTIKHLCRK